MTDSNLSFIHPGKFLLGLGIRANQTVAHLGCGVGYYLIPAAKIVGRNGRVYGVDVRSDVLQEADGHARRDKVGKIITTLRSDLEKGPTEGLPDKCADWTLVVNVLYQADPQAVLKEAQRVTKQGGMLVVVEWSTTATPLGPPNEARVSREEVKALLSQLGINILQEIFPSPYHYGLLAKV